MKKTILLLGSSNFLEFRCATEWSKLRFSLTKTLNRLPVFEVNGSSLLSVFNDPEEDIGVNGTLVGLVQNHPTVARQKRVCEKIEKLILDP